MEAIFLEAKFLAVKELNRVKNSAMFTKITLANFCKTNRDSSTIMRQMSSTEDVHTRC